MPVAAGAEFVPVASAKALRVAIVAAAAGDEIVLAPEFYTVSGRITCAAAGTNPLPIVVRAATVETALIHFDALESNELYDTRVRATANPVTKSDVVGGRRWIIRGNTISDSEKGAGDTVSYAAFLKGNSREELFERNFVVCERETRGGVRLGLSLGGGGISTQFCGDGDCTTERPDGTLRNNAIVSFSRSASWDGPCNGRPARLGWSEGQRE